MLVVEVDAANNERQPALTEPPCGRIMVSCDESQQSNALGLLHAVDHFPEPHNLGTLRRVPFIRECGLPVGNINLSYTGNGVPQLLGGP